MGLMGMRNLELALLRSFLVVARTQSLSAAALKIGRTQSALSMQMQRLEDGVGHVLLHRSGSGVNLTAMGERLAVHAERLLRVHDAAVSDLSGEGLHGSLAIGCTEDYSIAFLPQLLGTFCESHSKLQIQVVCAPTVELRPLLHRRQIELALTSVAAFARDVDIVRHEPLVWVGREASPSLLSRGEISVAHSDSWSIDHRAACEALQKGGYRYRIAYASSSLAGLIAVVRSGQAITVLTRSAIPPDLFTLTRDLPQLPSVGLTLEFSGESQSAAAKAFGDHIRHLLPLL
jgi:DNA-binding transcriptional LysR family regulator